MKCPNPKCKGGKRIQTTRTFDEGSMVRREKFCPKCRTKFFSLEFAEQAYNKTVSGYEARISELNHSIRVSQGNLDMLSGTVISLLEQVGFEPKKSKQNGKGKNATIVNKSKDEAECSVCGDDLWGHEAITTGICDMCRDDN